MVSGDKRNKTSPASKTVTAVKEVAERKKDEPKNKSASDPHPAKAESGEKGAELPAGYSRGRARNRFRKPIRITGMRFTRERKGRNDNWIGGPR